MKFLSKLLFFTNEVLTFYVPVFYTFRFLASRDPTMIARILKFWCVLSLASILQYAVSFILADNLDIVIDLLLHVLLIWGEFVYSQRIYDAVVRPIYLNNQQVIQGFTNNLDQYYRNKSREMQSRVSQSAADKVRAFIGDILVGTLNPNTRKRREQPPTVREEYESEEGYSSDRDD